MAFETFAEFRTYLNDLAVALTGKKASTNQTPHKRPNGRAARESYWRTGRRDGNSAESLMRNRAYLRAYREASGAAFSATGIRLGDGSYVPPDKSVIDRSLRDGHLRFESSDATLRLTPDGQAFLDASG